MLRQCNMEAAESSFSIPHWSSSVELDITGYYDPGQLRHAGNQDTGISCVLISNIGKIF